MFFASLLMKVVHSTGTGPPGRTSVWRSLTGVPGSDRPTPGRDHVYVGCL